MSDYMLDDECVIQVVEQVLASRLLGRLIDR